LKRRFASVLSQEIDPIWRSCEAPESAACGVLLAAFCGDEL
jgi:hypothetical protein